MLIIFILCYLVKINAYLIFFTFIGTLNYNFECKNSDLPNLENPWKLKKRQKKS